MREKILTELENAYDAKEQMAGAETIDRWRAIAGTDRWTGSGHAVMTHKTGEVLWACDFQDYAFYVPSTHGSTDYDEMSKEVAHFLVGVDDGKSRLPDCPPPPKDS